MQRRPPKPSFLADMSTFTPSDKLIVRGLLQAVEPFLNLRGPVPLRLLVLFLNIALDEGQESIEYADRLRLHRAVLSKLVHDLADRARGGGPGLGLVEFKYIAGNLHNRKPIFLTPKGRKLVAAILRSLQPTPLA